MNHPSLDDAGLSRSQLDIARAVLTGASNRAIADKLFVTEKTVKFHVTEIFKRCEVKNRGGLIAKYLPAQTNELLRMEVERLKQRIGELEQMLGSYFAEEEQQRRDRAAGILPTGRS